MVVFHVKAADTITSTDCLLIWWKRFLSGTSFFWPLLLTRSFWLFIGICSRKSFSSCIFIIFNYMLNHLWICFKFFKQKTSFSRGIIHARCFETFELSYSFSFEYSPNRSCEIFNPSTLSFVGTWIPGWSSWEQIIPLWDLCFQDLLLFGDGQNLFVFPWYPKLQISL